MVTIGNGEVRIDRRIRKTKKAIKTAFMDLASKNDISKITVTEISDLADINRKTFYAYYNDVYAVIDEIENDIVEKFLSIIDEYDIDKFVSNPYPILKQLTSFINEDIDFYGQFFNTNAAGAILDKIKKIIKDKLIVILNNKASIDPTLLHYSIDYSLGGLIAAYREWLTSDRNISLEELSKHLCLITANGLQPVLG